MNKIQVLDCTLRDGGYCNQWRFGFENVKTITDALVCAEIDIVECGFLTNRVTYDPETTKFSSVEEVAAVIPRERADKLFVVMMNYGEYDAECLPECDGSSVDGIRVAFHKKDLAGALEACRVIQQKGYKVFIQAMVSLCYQDEEFLSLIRSVNEFKPYAFYIVDSFGMMKSKDLVRLFYMVEHNLCEETRIGFHSHNNMQLAYSNSQTLVCLQTSRNLIIDTSVYGMGRGAGNLNTELFITYLNENFDSRYDIKPLLKIIDRILNGFYQRSYWGYSLPNYLSASHNAHPNYAGYLDDKKTLTVEDMNEIFNMMDEDKKVSFDKAYIEQLYLRYMAHGCAQEEHKAELSQKLKGKTVVLIAPGKSSVCEREKIISYIGSTGAVSISVNFAYSYCEPDYIFISNIRRYRELDEQVKKKCIITSNISDEQAYLKLNYRDFLTDFDAVKDNAGLMAVRFLISCGVEKICLAGFDGYSHDVEENYGDKQMEMITPNPVLDAMNIGMRKALADYAKQVTIEFLTTPKRVFLEEAPDTPGAL